VDDATISKTYDDLTKKENQHQFWDAYNNKADEFAKEDG
jgi:hypothetical protein